MGVVESGCQELFLPEDIHKASGWYPYLQCPGAVVKAWYLVARARNGLNSESFINIELKQDSLPLWPTNENCHDMMYSRRLLLTSGNFCRVLMWEFQVWPSFSGVPRKALSKSHGCLLFTDFLRSSTAQELRGTSVPRRAQGDHVIVSGSSPNVYYLTIHDNS